MTATWIVPGVVLLLAYLLGSIPFGLIVTRLAGAGDLRSIGSGNIGATNVLRTGRKGLAALTLLLDAGKGVAAVLIAQRVNPSYGDMAGLAAFLGHCYPIWLRFQGGKGVAACLGVLAALSWQVTLILVAVWAVTLALARTSSLASLAAAIAAPVATVVLGRIDLLPLVLALALLVVWKHRPNIGRLLAGTEPRVGATKPA